MLTFQKKEEEYTEKIGNRFFLFYKRLSFILQENNVFVK